MAVFALLLFIIQPAGAHFFGATQEIDGFQIIFAPSPSSPLVGKNSTLNFSVLENGHNLFNIYAAIKVQDKSTGEVVFQDPYKQYEISDITVPYAFSKPGDFDVTIETRIPEHETYQAQPLSATFPISAFPPGIPLDELLFYYITPASIAAAGIAVYLHSRKKI